MNTRTHEAYGQKSLTFVDRAGVWLSQRAIVRHLPERSDLEVLELGCGFWAAQLVALEDRLKHGVGVDFQIAPELRALGKFTFFEGTIEETLPKLATKSFDAILLISVLEHLVDPLLVIRSARAMLKPSGVLLIDVPSWLGKSFLEFSAFRLGLSPRLEMDDHKMYYDKRDLWPLLVRAGFRPSQIKLRYHKFRLNLFAVAVAKMSSQPRPSQYDWDTHWHHYAHATGQNPAQGMRYTLITKLFCEMAESGALRVFDVGSGQGDLLQKLQALLPEAKFLGAELSESGVAISRRKVPQATFLVADIFQPPAALNHFEGWATHAVCSEVLEHVDDPASFLKHAGKYLAPQARLIVTVPGGPMSAFDRRIGHRQHFDRRQVRALLEQAGYAVERVYLAGFPFFNLYRFLVIARGKRLAQDVGTQSSGISSALASFTMKLFRLLFRFNLRDSPFGWQVIAVARKTSQ